MWRRSWAAVATVGLVVACSGDDGSSTGAGGASGNGGASGSGAVGGSAGSGGSTQGCAPYSTLPCSCPGNASGVQTCAPDGKSYGGCDCGAGGTSGASCADLASQQGWRVRRCESGGNGVCGGVGTATSDCDFCCSGPSCGDLATQNGWSGAKCESGGNGACNGQGDTTYDCDHCCSGGGGGTPGFMLPLACGTSATITQGNDSAFSHNGKAQYAFDFGVGLNTPLVAMEGGRVIMVRNDVQPGNPCYSGGGSSCANTVNYVVLDHGDGTTSLYMHVNSTDVQVNDMVQRGQVVAHSGGTGWSTGPHAHVQRQQNCGSWWCQSVPLSFLDVPGSGVPTVNQSVTSQNGC